MKNEDRPHVQYAFLTSVRCGAYSRRTGKPCRQPAMANGRCRMHGGKSTGVKGNKNAFKHGYYSKDAKMQRQLLRRLKDKLDD